jgi:UDP-glucuronate 4-epimerase
MTRVLVTGAAGFLGSHVAETLLARGETVTGLDNFDAFYGRPIKEANIAGLLSNTRFTMVEGDIRDAGLVRGLLESGDAVVHLAARAGVRPSLEDPALYASVNVTGTTTLLEAARAAGVSAFVFAGSSSVYGDTAPVPFREDFAALNPISPYAATKRAGELLCSTFVHLYGMRIMSLRFFTAYGPRQRPDLAIHKFTRLLAAGQPVPQFGDGSMERDHTWVDDIVQGVVAARDWAARADGPAFEIVNLGESRTVRLDRLIALIGAALGVTPTIDRRPMQPGDVQRTCADISRARTLLGYRPTTAIEDGIPRFIQWFKEAHGRQT